MHGRLKNRWTLSLLFILFIPIIACAATSQATENKTIVPSKPTTPIIQKPIEDDVLVNKSDGGLLIEPTTGKAGTKFKITARSLRPHQMVTIKAVYCMNEVCTENKTTYIRKGEDEYTSADGTLVSWIQTDNTWEGGSYNISVGDDYIVSSGHIEIDLHRMYGLGACGKIGCCAPDFDLRSLSGGTVTLPPEYESGLSARSVVWINFWNTACPGCIDYMKIIQHIKDDWRKGDLKIFSINSGVYPGEDPTKVTKFLNDRGYNFYKDPDYPVLIESNSYGGLKDRYQTKGDPSHYFIDTKGIIRMTKFGYRSINSEDQVREIIDAIH